PDALTRPDPRRGVAWRLRLGVHAERGGERHPSGARGRRAAAAVHPDGAPVRLRLLWGGPRDERGRLGPSWGAAAAGLGGSSGGAQGGRERAGTRQGCGDLPRPRERLAAPRADPGRGTPRDARGPREQERHEPQRRPAERRPGAAGRGYRPPRPRAAALPQPAVRWLDGDGRWRPGLVAGPGTRVR